MRLAAQDLHQYGPQYILIKGGHTAEATGYSAKVGHAAGLPGGLEEDAGTGASAAARGTSLGGPRRLPARGGPGGRGLGAGCACFRTNHQTPPAPPALSLFPKHWFPGFLGAGRQMVTDLLYDGRTFLELSDPWVYTRNSHGTGCTLASALAAEMAKGHDVPAAARRAKRYLWRALERSADLPIGGGVQVRASR